jgi:hypothetical protein
MEVKQLQRAKNTIMRVQVRKPALLKMNGNRSSEASKCEIKKA